MPLTPRVPFTDALAHQVARAIYRTGVRWAAIDLAYQRWCAGQSVADIPCAEEARGKSYGVESLCRCEGCTTRTCFAFFDQVRSNFGRGA